jgi:hypothetical protein
MRAAPGSRKHPVYSCMPGWPPRLVRYLERQGLLEKDVKHSYLTLDSLDEERMDQLRGDSITYRIAVGPQRGRKVFA